eukprot:1067660-Amphidinium_carterae.1
MALLSGHLATLTPLVDNHTNQARPVVMVGYGESPVGFSLLLNTLARPGVLQEPPLSVPDPSWSGQKEWAQALTSRQDRRPIHPPLFPVVDALARPGSPALEQWPW